ncbi:Alpha/beta hydrolase family protein [Shimia sp. SK013]|uniref:alpha/beta hydrolase n=1 Tax=Shimia sp. SK013 TaxID=1389006 RepID=UPI0006B4B044|nr:alpha/beta hydrolase [Shimia sp. SK013]KPA22100.1 Alpha/beta hydrolase family protein [Shimia sp. SK013]
MRLAFRLLALTIGLAFAAVTLAGPAGRLLIYPFDKTQVTPADAGLSGVTEQAFDFDGETLVVWTAPPRKGKPVIFYLHGNAGNLAARAGRFRRFTERGYGLIALAYPGSSGSTGTPSESKIIETARSVWRSHVGLLDPESGPTSFILYGESLGTAPALVLADAHLMVPRRPTALILEAPFTSIPNMAEHHYPGTGELAKNLLNRWDSLSAAKSVTVPLFIMHGTDDTLIPIEMGRQIHAAARSKSKEFLAVKGAGHTDLWRSDTLPKLYAFIDQFAFR